MVEVPSVIMTFQDHTGEKTGLVIVLGLPGINWNPVIDNNMGCIGATSGAYVSGLREC